MSEYPLNYLSEKSPLWASEFTAPTNPRTSTPHLSQTNPARWTYQKLVECISSLEKSFDDEHEIGARLVSFGSSVTFHLQDMNYYDPNIINFYGKNERGEELQLIQHVSQLSVMLITLKKHSEEPVRIGFKLLRALEEES
jgi:hypothetical protein